MLESFSVLAHWSPKSYKVTYPKISSGIIIQKWKTLTQIQITIFIIIIIIRYNHDFVYDNVYEDGIDKLFSLFFSLLKMKKNRTKGLTMSVCQQSTTAMKHEGVDLKMQQAI